MRLIFLGPPGSGKGTQAKLLSQRMGLLHFATGNILREAIDKGTPEGRRANPYMANGQLVPDDLVNDIVRARFRSSDKPTQFVMDGYPRTLTQALSFDEILKEQGLDLNAVIFLKVADEEIVRRNSARWTCMNPACGATYNTAFRPPRQTGRCDVCQQLLFQREDDKAETIRKRLQVFHELHADVLRHYQERNLLAEVPGTGDVEAIYARIGKVLGK